ncbi:GMC oxidoreductase [Streptomyces sp. NPDC055078]
MESRIRTAATTFWHQCGTARTGVDGDTDAVDDSALRVRGSEDLTLRTRGPGAPSPTVRPCPGRRAGHRSPRSPTARPPSPCATGGTSRAERSQPALPCRANAPPCRAPPRSALPCPALPCPALPCPALPLSLGRYPQSPEVGRARAPPVAPRAGGITDPHGSGRLRRAARFPLPWAVGLHGSA